MHLSIASAPVSNQKNEGILYYAESYDTLKADARDYVDNYTTCLADVFHDFLATLCVEVELLDRIYATSKKRWARKDEGLTDLTDHLVGFLTEVLEAAYPNNLVMVDDTGSPEDNIQCFVFETPKIVIPMNGGLIEEIVSDIPVEVLQLDYDIEGADKDELIKVGTKECTVWIADTSDDGQYNVDVNPKRIAKLFKEARKGFKKQGRSPGGRW